MAAQHASYYAQTAIWLGACPSRARRALRDPECPRQGQRASPGSRHRARQRPPTRASPPRLGGPCRGAGPPGSAPRQGCALYLTSSLSSRTSGGAIQLSGRSFRRRRLASSVASRSSSFTRLESQCSPSGSRAPVPAPSRLPLITLTSVNVTVLVGDVQRALHEQFGTSGCTKAGPLASRGHLYGALPLQGPTTSPQPTGLTQLRKRPRSIVGSSLCAALGRRHRADWRVRLLGACSR